MSKNPLPSDLTLDDPCNWDFPNMSKEELKACCCWEYARESGFIRDVQRRCAALKLQDTTKIKDFISARHALEPDLQRIYASGYVATLIAGEFLKHPSEPCYPRPWRALSERDRQIRTPAARPRPAAFSRAEWNYAEEIVQQAEQFVQTAPCPPEIANGPKPRAWYVIPPSSFIREGAEVGLFRIHWDSFDDDELAARFKQWAEKCRPLCFRKPKCRPRGGLNWRAALRCLAIMRVLRDRTATEVSRDFPQLYLSCNKKHFRDQQRARQIFRERFAIGGDELPLSL